MSFKNCSSFFEDLTLNLTGACAVAWHLDSIFLIGFNSIWVPCQVRRYHLYTCTRQVAAFITG